MAALLPRVFAWVARLRSAWMAMALRPLVALGLCLCLGLTACSGSGGGLTGNYVDDTVSVATSLLGIIAVPQDDPGHPEAEAQARIDAQWPLARKVAVATHVIDNSGTRPRLEARALEVYTELVVAYGPPARDAEGGTRS